MQQQSRLCCRCSLRRLHCFLSQSFSSCVSANVACSTFGRAPCPDLSIPLNPSLPPLRKKEHLRLLAVVAPANRRPITEALVVIRIPLESQEVPGKRQTRGVAVGHIVTRVAVKADKAAAIRFAPRATSHSEWSEVKSPGPARAWDAIAAIFSADTSSGSSVSLGIKYKPRDRMIVAADTKRLGETSPPFEGYSGFSNCFRQFSSTRVRKGLSRRVVSPALPESFTSTASLQQLPHPGAQKSQHHASLLLEEAQHHQGDPCVSTTCGQQLLLRHREKMLQELPPAPGEAQQQSRRETHLVQALLHRHDRDVPPKQPLAMAEAVCVNDEGGPASRWYQLGALQASAQRNENGPAEEPVACTSPPSTYVTSPSSNVSASPTAAAIATIQKAEDENAFSRMACGFQGRMGGSRPCSCQPPYQPLYTGTTAPMLLADIQALLLELERSTGDKRRLIRSSIGSSCALLLQRVAQYDGRAVDARQSAGVCQSSVYSKLNQMTNAADAGAPTADRILSEKGESISSFTTPLTFNQVVYAGAMEPLPLVLRVNVLHGSLQSAFLGFIRRLLQDLRHTTLTLVMRFENLSHHLLSSGDIPSAAAAAASETAWVNQQATDLLQLLLPTIRCLSELQQQQVHLVREALQLFSAVLLMRTPLLCFRANQQSASEGGALISDADLETASRACDGATAAGFSSPELLDFLLHPLFFRRLSLTALERLLDAVRVEADPRHVQQLREQIPFPTLFEDAEEAFFSPIDSSVHDEERENCSNSCETNSTYTSSSRRTLTGIPAVGSSKCEVENDHDGTYISDGGRGRSADKTSSRRVGESSESSRNSYENESKRPPEDGAVATTSLDHPPRAGVSGDRLFSRRKAFSINRTRLAAKAFAALTATVDVDTQAAEEVLQRLEVPLRNHLKSIDLVTVAAVQRGVRLLISSKEAALRSMHQQQAPLPPFANSPGKHQGDSLPQHPVVPEATEEVLASAGEDLSVERIYKPESVKKKAFFYPRGAGDALRLQRQADMYAPWLALLEVLYTHLQQRLRALEKIKTLPTDASCRELLAVLRLLPGTYFDSFAHHRGKILRLRYLLWKIVKKQQPIETLSTRQLLQQLELLLLHSLYLSDSEALLKHVNELDINRRPDLLYTDNMRQLATAVRIASKMNDFPKQLFFTTASKILLSALSSSSSLSVCGDRQLPLRCFTPSLKQHQPHDPPAIPVDVPFDQENLALFARNSFAPEGRIAVPPLGRADDPCLLAGVPSSSSEHRPTALQQKSAPRLHARQRLPQEEKQFPAQPCEQTFQRLTPESSRSRGENRQMQITLSRPAPRVAASSFDYASHMLRQQSELRRRRVRLETLVDITAALQRAGAEDPYRTQLWEAVGSFYARHSKPFFSALVQQQNALQSLSMIGGARVSDNHCSHAVVGCTDLPESHAASLGTLRGNSFCPSSSRVSALETSVCCVRPHETTTSQQFAATPRVAAPSKGAWLTGKRLASDTTCFCPSTEKPGIGEEGTVGAVSEKDTLSVFKPAVPNDAATAFAVGLSADDQADEVRGFDMSVVTCVSVYNRVLQRRLLLFRKQVACEEDVIGSTRVADILSPAAAAVGILESAAQQQQQRGAAELIRWLRCGVLLLQHSLISFEETNIDTASNICEAPARGSTQQDIFVPRPLTRDTESGDLMKPNEEETHREKQPQHSSGQLVALQEQQRLQDGLLQRQKQLAQLVFEALLENPSVEGSAGKVPLLEILPHGMIAEAVYAFCCMRFHKTQATLFSQLLAKLPAPLVPVDNHVAMLLWKALATLQQEGDNVIRWRFSRFTHDTLNPLAWAAKASPAQLEKLFRPYKKRCQSLFKAVASALQKLTVHFAPWPSAVKTDGFPLAFIVHLCRDEITQMEQHIFSASFFNTPTRRLLLAPCDIEHDAPLSQIQVPALHSGSLGHAGCEEHISTNVVSYKARNICYEGSSSPDLHTQVPTILQGEPATAEWRHGIRNADFEDPCRPSLVCSKPLRIGVLLIPSAFSAAASESVGEEPVQRPANPASVHGSCADTLSKRRVAAGAVTSAQACSWAPASRKVASQIPRNRNPIPTLADAGDVEQAAAFDASLSRGKNVGELIAGALRAKGWKRLVVVAEDGWCQQQDDLKRVALLVAQFRNATQQRATPLNRSKNGSLSVDCLNGK